MYPMIKAIHKLLPASTSVIKDIGTITADNILHSLDLGKVEYQVHRLSDGDWELEASELTDGEILARLKICDAGHAGRLLICTEACTRCGLEPFTCESDQLEEFVERFDRDMFFDGDVVILSEQSRTLTVYHHAGGYVHVKLLPTVTY